MGESPQHDAVAVQEEAAQPSVRRRFEALGVRRRMGEGDSLERRFPSGTVQALLGRHRLGACCRLLARKPHFVCRSMTAAASRLTPMFLAMALFGTSVLTPSIGFAAPATAGQVMSAAQTIAAATTPSSQTWIQLNTTGQTPPFGAATGDREVPYDSVNNRLILFGGGLCPRFNATWVLTNANGLGGTPTWIQLAPTGALPAPRSFSANAYDAADNRLIVFGGGGGCGDFPPPLNDTWVLTNANGLGGAPQWIQLAPAGGPPAPRLFTAAAYDPGSNRLIVFGGCNGGGSSSCGTLLGDTWVLTNANGLGGAPQWIQLTTSGTVQPRSSNGLAYDPTSNHLMVYGGDEPSCSDAGDVSVLTNANGLGGTPQWSVLQPSPAGPGKFDMASAYDAPDNQLIVAAGVGSSPPCGGGTFTNDVWSLSGANGLTTPQAWTQLAPSGTPPLARESMDGAYDATSNRLILFGGCAAQCLFGVPLTDTWVLTNANGIAPAQLQISQSLPNQGGNAGAVTAEIIGNDFAQGAQAKLIGIGPDIIGTNVTLFGSSGLQATFDLTGTAPGARNVVITNPDGTSATLAGGFSVESGGAAELSADVLVRPRYLANSPTVPFYVVVHNTGLIDAENVRLDLGASSGSVQTSSPLVTTSNTISARASSSSASSSGSTTFVVVPSGGTVTMGGNFTPGPNDCTTLADPCDWSMVNSTYLNLAAAETAFFGTFLLLAGNCALSAVLLNPQQCYRAYSILKDMGTTWDDAATDYEQAVDNLNLCLSAHNLPRISLPRTRLGLLFIPITSPFSAILTFLQSIPLAFITPPPPAHAPVDSPPTSCRVGAIDPNEEYGTPGVGNARYVGNSSLLTYVTAFQNLPQATAPAQQVVISDQLDGTKFDLKTFSLGPIQFGTTTVVPPPNVSQYSTIVDLRPANNLIVRFTGSLETNTGLATWRFTSLDPTTMLPPVDPLIGFLPPDNTPPQGEGSVLFNIMPKVGLQTGTQLSNQASVTFDLNSPIVTQPWINTMDVTPPTSRVNALPSTESTPTFQVQWSGSDVGAGLQDFSVYVSQDGGPFTAWLTNTPAISGTFVGGQPGSTYAFYSIARDLVGNVEAAKTQADTTTKIIAAPPVTTATASPTPNTAGWNNTNVIVQLTSTPNGSAQVQNIEYTLSGAQTGSGTISGASGTVTISAEGSTTLTFAAIDSFGDQELPKSLNVKIDKTPPALAFGAPSPVPNANGWNNTDVTVPCTASDALSGVATATPACPLVLSAEGS